MELGSKKNWLIGGAVVIAALIYLYLRNRASAASEPVDASASIPMPTFAAADLPTLSAPALASLDELIASLDGSGNGQQPATPTTPTTSTNTNADPPATTTTGTVEVDHSIPTANIALGDGSVQSPVTRTGSKTSGYQMPRYNWIQ